MYTYTTTTVNPFNNYDLVQDLFKRALVMTIQSEGIDSFEIVYNELTTRPATTMLTSRTMKELDEAFFNTHRDNAGPFLLQLKINLHFIASSDMMLAELLTMHMSNTIYSLVYVSNGVGDNQEEYFKNSFAFMVKNTPVGYKMSEDACDNNGMSAWYCTMLFMYMFLPVAKEVYDILTIVE